MRIEAIEWDEANRAHATIRATEEEINQAIDNRSRVVTNRRGRSGDYLLHGATDGGRRLVVSIAYDWRTAMVRPITCWEER